MPLATHFNGLTVFLKPKCHAVVYRPLMWLWSVPVILVLLWPTFLLVPTFSLTMDVFHLVEHGQVLFQLETFIHLKSSFSQSFVGGPPLPPL